MLLTSKSSDTLFQVFIDLDPHTIYLTACTKHERIVYSEPITNEQSNDDSSTVGGDGDIEISASEEDQWICVPGENGDNFYFNTLNKELWKGPGVPKNIIEAPSVDSPIIPRR